MVNRQLLVVVLEFSTWKLIKVPSESLLVIVHSKRWTCGEVMGSYHSHEQKDGEGGSGFNTPRSGSRRGTTPRGSAGDIEKPEKPQPTSMVPVEKLGKVRAHKRTVWVPWMSGQGRVIRPQTSSKQTARLPAIACLFWRREYPTLTVAVHHNS